MATTATLRLRRSAAQLHALARVEREIRAADPNGRRKYLREFAEAFPSYHSVLNADHLEQALAAADLLMIGDYHALAACQRFCAGLIAERASRSNRSLVLGVEAVYSRDQHILNDWLAGAIGEEELRERIRYDIDWQYDWSPFYELLQSARAYGARIYGLDCMPRADMRKIGLRDKHAAGKIAEIRSNNPESQIIVLFGESHLAPSHLPAEVKALLPSERMLSVLQNLDALYWQAAGEQRPHVEAVRISEEAVCVFNATPLEKYESYRLYLDRWRCERGNTLDFGPAFYNLIDALLRFLHIDKYRTRGRNSLVDTLPEVYSRTSAEALRRLLVRKRASSPEMERAIEELRDHGSCYIPRMNAIFACRLEMRHNAHIAAQFVQIACAGHIGRHPVETASSACDNFYLSVIEQALVYLGSRVLYPARPPVRESDYYALYAHPREVVEFRGLYTHREYTQMLDFLIFHKDYEINRHRYLQTPQLIEEAIEFSSPRKDFVTRELALMLGSDLYDAYVAGQLSQRSLRSLFFRDLRESGAAHQLYFELARKNEKPQRRMAA